MPDGEYIIPQTIDADSSILSTVNTAESPYELSIDIKTNGDAEKELTVDESGYSAAIENDAMLGASFNVEITDTCNPEEIVLKYDIKEGYTENTLNKFSSLDKKKAPKYTSQSLNPSHQLLTSHADAVTNEEKLFDIYFSNYVIDEQGNEIYTLNLPNIVSKEESEALVYAFVTYIQNGKEKENEN